MDSFFSLQRESDRQFPALEIMAVERGYPKRIFFPFVTSYKGPTHFRVGSIFMSFANKTYNMISKASFTVKRLSYKHLQET